MAVSWRSCIQPVVIRTTLAWEWWRSGVTYYPLTPRVYRNPYPTYAKLRAQDPVHWNFLSQSWVLSRYRDIDAILRDHTRFSNEARHRRGLNQTQASASYPRGPSMLFLDPPDHTRLRALIQQAFTPRAIEALALRMRADRGASAGPDRRPDGFRRHEGACEAAAHDCHGRVAGDTY